MKIRFIKDYENDRGRIIKPGKIGKFTNEKGQEIIDNGFAEPVHLNILSSDEVLVRSADSEDEKEEKKVKKQGNKIVKR